MGQDLRTFDRFPIGRATKISYPPQNINELIEICRNSVLAGRNYTVVYNQIWMLVNQPVTAEQRDRIIACIREYENEYRDYSFMYYCQNAPAPPALPTQPQVQTQPQVPQKQFIQPSALEGDLVEADLDVGEDQQEAIIRSIRTPYDFFNNYAQINKVVNFVFAKVYEPLENIKLPANPRIDVGFDSKTGEKFIRMTTSVNCTSISSFSRQGAQLLAQQHYHPSRNQPGQYVGRFRSFPNVFYIAIEDVGFKFATVESRRKGITITKEHFDDFFGNTIGDALQRIIP